MLVLLFFFARTCFLFFTNFFFSLTYLFSFVSYSVSFLAFLFTIFLSFVRSFMHFFFFVSSFVFFLLCSTTEDGVLFCNVYVYSFARMPRIRLARKLFYSLFLSVSLAPCVNSDLCFYNFAVLYTPSHSRPIVHIFARQIYNYF